MSEQPKTSEASPKVADAPKAVKSTKIVGSKYFLSGSGVVCEVVSIAEKDFNVKVVEIAEGSLTTRKVGDMFIVSGRVLWSKRKATKAVEKSSQ